MLDLESTVRSGVLCACFLNLMPAYGLPLQLPLAQARVAEITLEAAQAWVPASWRLRT